jgi:hypothetical protein
LIGDFRPLASRTDAGHLFENYLIAEREAYPDATWTPVSRDNYVEFVTGLI